VATVATIDEHLRALDEERAFRDRSLDRAIVVRGDDARRWLGDLVTADVATLEPGTSRRSLLLSSTGRIRADLTLAERRDGSFLILQDAAQPEPVGGMLTRYVLSSAVQLEDATTGLALFEHVASGRLTEHAPSEASEVVVDTAAWNIWRIRRGDPLMGVDFAPGALPAEAGLERTIDLQKGCFLGQESVAKIRNLGHPPRTLRHLRSDVRVVPGGQLAASGAQVGIITSVAPASDSGWILLATVDWAAADVALTTSDGAPVSPIAG
jgi:folate-binding protein YgfZ